jgi:hypothetical protein
MQITHYNTTAFETIKKLQDGVEYWDARELQTHLGYSRWEKFKKVIQSVFNEIEFETGNFHQAGKFYKEPTARKNRENADLSRLACYKIAMRGETQECIQARTYFATQTRKQEIQETQTALSNPFELMQAMLNQMKSQQEQLDTQGQRIQALESKPSGTQVNITTIKDYKEFRKEELMEKWRRPIDALVHAKFKHISPELRWDFARRLYETEVGWIFPKVSKANERQFEHFFNWLNES